jgi:hypothetical protein
MMALIEAIDDLREALRLVQQVKPSLSEMIYASAMIEIAETALTRLVDEGSIVRDIYGGGQ